MNPFSMRLIAVGAFVAMAAAATPAYAAAPAGDLVVNGSLDNGVKGWWASKNTPIKVTGGQLCAQVPAGGDNMWAAMIGQSGIAVQAGQTYQLSFEATATKTTRIRSVVQGSGEKPAAIVDGYPEVGGSPKKFTYAATAKVSDSEAQVLFQVGGADAPYTLCLDNVSLVPVHQSVVNGSLDNGVKGWWASKNTPITVTGGRLCAQVPAGGDNVWASMVGQSGIAVAAGKTYRLSFKASATRTAKIRSVVQGSGETHTAIVDGYPEVGTGSRTYAYQNTAKTSDREAQVLFQLGGADAPYTLCLDDILLTD
ncbi:carbohydrate binding domain-containing protein (plasmid) [Microtetraspora malaysiensis]|uniref:carbohydrate binding domain-containing protein n=1 Tax=Microtetraspora malaysiensis TaxID=161358 RepID=UPI003D9208EE